MSFHNLSISVLKVGRQLASSLAVAAFFMLAFVACIKEEEPVTPHQAGDAITRSIAMASDYRFQIFYNLEKDSIVSQNLRWDWDLAFDASTEGGTVFLNQSKYMFATATGKVNLTDVRDTSGVFSAHRWDAMNRPDSLAIGNVKNNNTIYWLDLGFDQLGDPTIPIKIKFDGVDGKSYRFSYASLTDGVVKTAEVLKDTQYNRVYFSFTKHKQVVIEPKKTDYDLSFTQYMFTFTNPYTAYLVTGVILNPNNTVAVADSTLSFDKIDRNVAQTAKLEPQQDVIGYDWKAFSNSVYKIQTRYNYIIRDQKGYFYKLRFIDFYDERGTKGTPKFEFQRL